MMDVSSNIQMKVVMDAYQCHLLHSTKTHGKYVERAHKTATVLVLEES